MERVVLVGIGLKTKETSDSTDEIRENLMELEELVLAAGGEVVGLLIQILPQFNPATLIGSGKVEEVHEMVQSSQAQVVVVDHHLSGVQTRNLELAIGCPVRDRNQVILDIFSQRARTYEGRLQVELARMLDQLPRMVDAWMGSLSRQGGGIGTRGPGEAAIEVDRRRIRERVTQIRKKLEQVRGSRAQHRASRRRHEVPSFALIGYTNSGKSSLLNRLTGAQVVVKNQVFATLDPTTRKIFLPNGPPAVVTDTVGFIRKLPTQLIEAFKATLEESAESDILLHVIDLSSPNMVRQIEVVNELILELGWVDKKVIHVFNKIDKISSQTLSKTLLCIPESVASNRALVSALTGAGLDSLKALMIALLQELYSEEQVFIPFEENHRIYDLGRETHIFKQESGSAGTVCYVRLTPLQKKYWSKYLV